MPISVRNLTDHVESGASPGSPVHAEVPADALKSRGAGIGVVRGALKDDPTWRSTPEYEYRFMTAAWPPLIWSLAG